MLGPMVRATNTDATDYGWHTVDMTHADNRCAVITDPSDPKFDLEAYLTQVQKDNP